jgi:Transposase Tn5 dimerisation domain
MTMIKRTAPDCSQNVAFTVDEVTLLDKLVKNKPALRAKKKTISDYIVKLACLGGYLNRASDSEPGNKVIWRGLARLTDINLGFELARQRCG